MADKAPGIKKAGGDSKTLLIAGLLCVFLALAWGAYEFLRPLTPDEIKEAKENAKIQAEIDKANKKKGP
ncbi:MAG TPA: hypothetical protein VKX17_14420 [Planctomycetota bacterium]|nr:hypothetical protein [Planctomycetota bacterium]